VGVQFVLEKRLTAHNCCRCCFQPSCQLCASLNRCHQPQLLPQHTPAPSPCRAQATNAPMAMSFTSAVMPRPALPTAVSAPAICSVPARTGVPRFAVLPAP